MNEQSAYCDRKTEPRPAAAPRHHRLAVADELSIMTSSCRSRPLRGGGPRLAPRTGAGFLFQRPLPGTAGSYMASVRPLAARESRLRAPVHVSVLSVIALLAAVGPLLQGQLGFHCPQDEHVFVLGNQRSATTSFPPFHAVVLQHSPRRSESLVGDSMAMKACF